MASAPNPSGSPRRNQPVVPNIQVEPPPSSQTQLTPQPTHSQPPITRQRSGDPGTHAYPLLQRPPLSGGRDRASTIRIRRQPSQQTLNGTTDVGNDAPVRRRRSTSEPQRTSWPPTADTTGTDLDRATTAGSGLPNIQEGQVADHQTATDENTGRLSVARSSQDEASRPPSGRIGRLRAATTNSAARGLKRMSSFQRLGGRQPDSQPVSDDLEKQTSRQQSRPQSRQQVEDQEYDSKIVDLLDVVDPEVSTLSTLTNVQNSLFIPDLGRWLNRRPTYDLSPRHSRRAQEPQPPGAYPITEADRADEKKSLAPSRISGAPSTLSTTPSEPFPPIQPKEPSPPKTPKSPKPPPRISPEDSDEELATQRKRTMSIDSTMSDTRFAVLPHGITLVGWTDEDKEMLDDHVRHMLHSKRSAFKRSMKGFWKYVQKPLGFFVTVYAVLITLFGAAWVLFLIGWINVGGKQLYVINVIDNVLVALFAIMGDGLAPFRAVDTYHMVYIAHYHYLSWKRRRENNLPKLKNHNDLPTEVPTTTDVEAGLQEKLELSVLSPEQQRKLNHHSQKYSKSHTFYRPHETETHNAFPVKLLITVTVLLDFHSIFQICLGTVTWSTEKHKHGKVTAAILCCSICCNIAGGVVIAIGDRITRKKEIIELHFRQNLTRTAIKKVQKHRRDDAKRQAIELGHDSPTAEQHAAEAVPVTHAIVPHTDLVDDDKSVIEPDDHNDVEVVPDDDPRIRTPEPEKTSLELAREQHYGDHTVGAFSTTPLASPRSDAPRQEEHVGQSEADGPQTTENRKSKRKSLSAIFKRDNKQTAEGQEREAEDGDQQVEGGNGHSKGNRAIKKILPYPGT